MQSFLEPVTETVDKKRMGFVTFQGSLYKLEGNPLLVVLTEMKTFRDRESAARLLKDFSHAYNGIPVILSTVDPDSGKPRYVTLPHHKPTLERFQKEIPFHSIEFREFKVYIE